MPNTQIVGYDESIQSSFNVGSPWVLFTSDINIVNKGSTNFITGLDTDIQDTNLVLLSFQEGNLLSFTEQWGSGSSEDAANVSFKFLDPEMKILPRLFKHTEKRLYNSFKNRIHQTLKTKPKSEISLEYRANANKEKLEDTYGEETGLTLVEQQKLLEDFITPSSLTNTYGEDKAPIIYMAYGMGTDPRKATPFRKVAITKFVMSQDSGDNGTVEMTAVFPPEDSRKVGTIFPDVTRTYSHQGTQSLASRPAVAAVPILRADVRDPRESRRGLIPSNRPDLNILNGKYIKDIEFSNVLLITSLLENLYQKYLIQTQPTRSNYRPFIFISPLAIQKFSDIIVTEEDRLEIESAADQAALRLHVIATILRKCGIQLVPERFLPNLSYISSTGRRRRGQRADEKVQTWYLVMYENPFASRGITDPAQTVYESLSELYSQLGINEVRMEGSQLVNAPNASKPTPLLEKTHAKAFVKQLCEKKFPGRDDILHNEYAIQTDIVAEVVGQRKVRASQYDGRGFGDELKVLLFGKDIYEDFLRIARTETNFNEIDVESVEKYDIEIFADSVITHALIYPVAPTFSLEALRLYEEEVVGHFLSTNNNVAEVLRYSNAYKFLFGSNGLKTDYREYLFTVSEVAGQKYKPITDDSLNIPDEFGVGIYQGLKPWLDMLPIFVANKDNANVYEVLNQEKNLQYATLVTAFSLFKGHAIKDLGDIITGPDASSVSWDESRTEEIIQSVVRNSFTNNVTLATALKGAQQVLAGDDAKTLADKNSIESKLRSTIQTLIDFTKEETVKANNLDVKKIDYDEFTMLQVFLQGLSNQVSIINIKTVPFFNINFPLWITKPVLFLNHTNFHAFVNNKIPPKGFLSGIYIITGYEHTIDKTDCHSKFFLQRHAMGTDALSGLIKKITEGEGKAPASS